MIVVESDCLVAMNMVNVKAVDESRHSMLAREIKILDGDGREVLFTHVCHEQNHVSHYLANYGRIEECAVGCGLELAQVMCMSFVCKTWLMNDE